MNNNFKLLVLALCLTTAAAQAAEPSVTGEALRAFTLVGGGAAVCSTCLNNDFLGKSGLAAVGAILGGIVSYLMTAEKNQANPGSVISKHQVLAGLGGLATVLLIINNKAERGAGG